MIAIPNKAGATGVINDMLNGSTQVTFLNAASQRAAGESRQPCARSRWSSHARLPDFPDVATMQELGFPGVGTIAWQGLFAPAGTPQPVLQAIFAATVAAMKEPAVVEAFKKQTFNLVPTHRSPTPKPGSRPDGHLAQDHQRSEDRDRVRAFP